MALASHDPQRDALRFEVDALSVTLRASLGAHLTSAVRVAVRGELITIWAQHADEAAPAGGLSSFCRTVRLPGPVIAAQARLSRDQDELTVCLPRRRGTPLPTA